MIKALVRRSVHECQLSIINRMLMASRLAVFVPWMLSERNCGRLVCHVAGFLRQIQRQWLAQILARWPWTFQSIRLTIHCYVIGKCQRSSFLEANKPMWSGCE